MGFVKLEQQGHVGIITIDRQEALNALNSQVLTDLNDVLDQVESNKDIYVAVLTGAGRSFVAGADIGEMKNPTQFSKAFSESNNVFASKTYQSPLSQQLMACLGWCEISMACDIRLASEG